MAAREEMDEEEPEEPTAVAPAVAAPTAIAPTAVGPTVVAPTAVTKPVALGNRSNTSEAPKKAKKSAVPGAAVAATPGKLASIPEVAAASGRVRHARGGAQSEFKDAPRRQPFRL
jgi:hypothetical protein